MGLDEKRLRLRRTHRHAPDCRCQRSHREALAVGEQQIALFDTQIPRDGANHDRMMRTVQVERDLRIEPAHEIERPPSEFDALASQARFLGFKQVVAGPFVRSSYHADEMVSNG